MRTYLVALLAILLLSFGQVLLKLLAVRGAAAGVSLANWQREAFSFAWLGASVVAIYACVLVCWLYVLTSLELNRAFAFVALAFALVPLFSYLLLGEKITVGSIAGSALIIFGILVATNY
jgi:drug/metabolite transporter (DMT)-like permease